MKTIKKEFISFIDSYLKPQNEIFLNNTINNSYYKKYYKTKINNIYTNFDETIEIKSIEQFNQGILIYNSVKDEYILMSETEYYNVISLIDKLKELEKQFKQKFQGDYLTLSPQKLSDIEENFYNFYVKQKQENKKLNNEEKIIKNIENNIELKDNGIVYRKNSIYFISTKIYIKDIYPEINLKEINESEDKIFQALYNKRFKFFDKNGNEINHHYSDGMSWFVTTESEIKTNKYNVEIKYLYNNIDKINILTYINVLNNTNNDLNKHYNTIFISDYDNLEVFVVFKNDFNRIYFNDELYFEKEINIFNNRHLYKFLEENKKIVVSYDEIIKNSNDPKKIKKLLEKLKMFK